MPRRGPSRAKCLRSRNPRDYADNAMRTRSFSFAIIGLLSAALWLHDSQANAERSDVPGVPAASNEAGTGNLDAATCSFRDKRLFGKVKVVESFPDVRVKVVDSFPDLKVKKVESFADECGEWQFVDSFPDFTIQYVDSFADVEIKMTNGRPGPDRT
jgi:hypothetical protein